MRPPLGATICGRGSRAVGVGEPRRGAPCPVRRGFYLFILVARFLRRPQKRHHGPGNAASGQAKPPLFPSMWCAQVIRHGLGHLSPARMVCRANERGGVPPGVQADGGSRVGIPAGAARSPARARTRAGMERGAAPALDATGAPPAYRQGGGTKGEARHPCPRSQSGKNRRGMQPEGGCPSEARRVSRWRQNHAIEEDPPSPNRNPAEAGCVRY